MNKRRLRIIKYLLIGFISFSLLLLIFCDRMIANVSRDRVSDSLQKVPETKVALVLGTVKTLKNGKTNQYFQFRINAAVDLYRNGKVRHFILSGDNHTKGYDEPEDMRLALIAAGIPDSCITLDYAGFRTLDSIVRCYEVFGQSRFIVVSQKFHNERAVFLAAKNGLDAYGYNAQDVSVNYGFKVRLREYFARIKACLDIYIFGTEPKFLGEKIALPL